MKKVRYFFGICVFALLGLVAFVPKATAISSNDLTILAVRTDAEEFIELKKNSQNSLLLTGLSIYYTNSSGNEYLVYEFVDGTELTGESLLLRLESTDSRDEADLNYSRNLSQTAGKISLVAGGVTMDEVCWGKMTGCETGNFGTKKKVLVKNASGEGFSFVEDYDPSWEAGREVLNVPEVQEEVVEPKCAGLQFSEILSYYESNKNEQFIEFFNTTADQINLEGCAVKYKNKTYPLEGIVAAEGFFVYYPTNFVLTKNPTNSNVIEIIDATGETVDRLEYFNGQKKAVAFAQFGYDGDGKEQWLQTYAATPGRENNYQKYKTCPEGKVINEETGNCVEKTSLNTGLAECPAGSYRNPLTNRCKKYATAASTELKACAEGYERNPETNRCRRIVTNEGSSYGLLADNFEEKSSFVAIWAIVGVGILGALYVIYEYRKEISKLFKKK